MKLNTDLSVNGRRYEKGSEIPWYMVYPFFGVHMLGFGFSGFYMAYGADDVELSFLFLHGGFACFVYTIFYLSLFGVDEVKWMFINSALGLLGIYAQIDLILSWFGKRADQFEPVVHVIPFLYYVLYTFLLRQMVLDITRARDHPTRRRLVEALYVAISVAFYGYLYFNH